MTRNYAGRRSPLGWLALAAALATPWGCRKSAPAVPPVEETKLAPIEIKKDAPGLFTYVDANGSFATTDKPAEIPEGARRVVRVVDPSKGVLDRRDTTNVYVVDVGQLLAQGKAMARPLSRGAFETGALAQLPPGASSLLSERPEGDAGSELAGENAPAAQGTPVVTVYGTSWCGACREARRYLARRNIPFVEKDIERDAAAARELAEKGRALGISTDRVPILDVRGRLLIGFDQARLEALLGQAS